MNIIRKGAIALAAVATLGTTTGFVVAAETASAAGPTVVTTTSVVVGESTPTPGLTVFAFNEYQPALTAPGFRLYATMSEVCLTGRAGTAVCNWRLNPTNAPLRTLTGNAVIRPAAVATGQAGLITGGTGTWRGARGAFRSANIAPRTAIDTFVFSTP